MSETDLQYWKARAEAAEAIVNVLFWQVTYRADNACGKCISINDMSKDREVPGFECAYHRAAKLVNIQQEPK